ncbi:hypothetical protein GGS20DRAFT_91208 [Poronia punctata]|nr:hypothetical protein GGS20DRAFT_91208 [Poronia punctata]
MEPLSILSVAAAVVQFLDFASGVLADTRETYKSHLDGSQSDIKLSKIASDFAIITHTASSKMAELVRQEDPDHPLKDYEKNTISILKGLCRDARDINRELQQTVRTLDERDNIRRIKLAAESFAAALKRAWSVDKIRKLEHRLDENRKQTTMAMLVLSWGQAENTRVTMKQFAIDQATLIEGLRNIDNTTKTYGQQILQLIRPQTNVKMQEARGILEYAIESRWAPMHSMTTATTQTEHAGIRLRERRLAEMISDSLVFETISHREDTVPIAYSDTFRWALERPKHAPNGSPLWADLCEWAIDPSSSIYWVYGKAGAGKSTLVKFLSQDTRLKESLQQWAGSSNLVLASYYSWNAGGTLQKSHKDLLQAILHRCLKMLPQLVPKLFPNRWALAQLFSPDSRPAFPDWQLWELLAGFRTLLSLADDGLQEAGLLFKVGLIIDGLDEFSDEEDHGILVELLQEAATHKNVKILASSRPWNVFRDAFHRSPSLWLEKLTQTDIEGYVHGQLEKSPGFSEQRNLHAEQAEKLMNDIVQKAQGVFLWVAVVMRTILVRLQEGDRLSDCQTTLDSLPKDINQLFLAIWKRASSLNNVEGAQYFRLLDICQRHDLVPYCLTVFLGDNDVPSESNLAILEESGLASAIASLSRRLNSRTRGLLEIRDTGNIWDSRVDYMHRTVKEWVAGNWDSIMSLAGPEFDAHLWILKGETLRASMPGNLPLRYDPETLWNYYQELFSVAAHVRDRPDSVEVLVQVLDKLDSTITAYFELEERFAPGAHSESESKRPVQPHWSVLMAQHKVWLPMPGLRSRGWENNDFVRLMAQVSIPQYVRHKLLHDPSVAEASPSVIPLLLSTIIGGCQENPQVWSAKPRSMSERLDLVNFVLPCVSPEEAQKILTYMGEDSFFMRSWDSVFIATAKHIIGDHLRLEGLIDRDSRGIPDSGNSPLIEVDSLTVVNSTVASSANEPSIKGSKRSTQGRTSVRQWTKTLFFRHNKAGVGILTKPGIRIFPTGST